MVEPATSTENDDIPPFDKLMWLVLRALEAMGGSTAARQSFKHRIPALLFISCAALTQPSNLNSFTKRSRIPAPCPSC
jgi:hypothetical protein